MAPGVSKRRWATAAEWSTHKDTICRLYRDMELDDLMEIMEREHRFYSTYSALSPPAPHRGLANK